MRRIVVAFAAAVVALGQTKAPEKKTGAPVRQVHTGVRHGAFAPLWRNGYFWRGYANGMASGLIGEGIAQGLRVAAQKNWLDEGWEDYGNAPVPPEISVYRVALPIDPPLVENPVPAPLPRTDPWKILSASGEIANSNGSVCSYAWKFTVRNNTYNDLSFAGSLDLVDRDGFTVESVNLNGVRVLAGAEQEITGQKMMVVDSAQTVVSPRVKLEALR